MNEESHQILCSDKNDKDSSFKTEMNNNLKLHWDNAYKRSASNQLGWFEKFPEPSLRLIKKCNLDKNASLLNVGAGTTTLIDELLKLGYNNILANDLSSTALNGLKERLGNESNKVKWIVDDLTQPAELHRIEPVDLWHDRAVLHFFIDKKDQDTYFNLLKKLIKTKGFVIIATFNLQGVTKCSGLPVFRYNEQMLQTNLGDDFKLIEAFDFTYFMPSGDQRAYVYTLFQRN
jgi:SAM-dependent methyltransferase